MRVESKSGEKQPVMEGYFPIYNFMKQLKRIPNFLKNPNFPIGKSQLID
jgi:hypothetical protein